MDLKLSNQVFNSLKQHCYSEQRRSARLHEKKEHSTAVRTGTKLQTKPLAGVLQPSWSDTSLTTFMINENSLSPQEQAVDHRTRLLMFKMVNAGVLENINGCISTGKESVVFHADGGRWVMRKSGKEKLDIQRMPYGMKAYLPACTNLFFCASAWRNSQSQMRWCWRCLRRRWMSSGTETATSKTTTASSTASASWTRARSSGCGPRRRCTTWPGDYKAVIKKETMPSSAWVNQSVCAALCLQAS